METTPLTRLAAHPAPGSHATLVAAWLEHALPAGVALGELAEATLRPYRRAAHRWLAHLAGRDCPTPADVRAWVAQLRATKLAQATVATYLAAVKSLYRWAEVQGRYPDIARAVKSPRLVKDAPLPCPTSAEVGCMFRSIDDASLRGKRDRALLAIMFSTALRCVSLRRALVGDVDFEAGTIRHQPKGHREKDAVAVLSATAREALADYLAARAPVSASDALFASAGHRRSASGALSTRSMRAKILALSEAQGLARRAEDGALRNPGHFSAHSIRRASITAIAEALGLEVAQTLAGHQSVDTTRRVYARINKYRQLQATARALDL